MGHSGDCSGAVSAHRVRSARLPASRDPAESAAALPQPVSAAGSSGSAGSRERSERMEDAFIKVPLFFGSDPAGDGWRRPMAKERTAGRLSRAGAGVLSAVRRAARASRNDRQTKNACPYTRTDVHLRYHLDSRENRAHLIRMPTHSLRCNVRARCIILRLAAFPCTLGSPFVRSVCCRALSRPDSLETRDRFYLFFNGFLYHSTIAARLSMQGRNFGDMCKAFLSLIHI